MPRPPIIDTWGGGGFRILGEWHAGSLLIIGDARRAWMATRVEDLAPQDFAAVFESGAAVSPFILLGTGQTAALPPRSVRDSIREAGMGVEFMASEAAARLHNVLVSEGRSFATALIAV